MTKATTPKFDIWAQNSVGEEFLLCTVYSKGLANLIMSFLQEMYDPNKKGHNVTKVFIR